MAQKALTRLHKPDMIPPEPVAMTTPCPLCKREDAPLSDHHLTPKTRGGTHKETVSICIDCHTAVHAQFSNKDLERTYNTVEMLLTHDTFSRTVKFISKQNTNKRIKTKLSSDQKMRGRNG